MVKWYKTYLEVYGKSFDEISDDSIRKVKRQLKERQNDSPLVSVVLIAHNEERHLISCIWSLSENHCHFPIEIIAVTQHRFKWNFFRLYWLSTGHSGKCFQYLPFRNIQCINFTHEEKSY